LGKKKEKERDTINQPILYMPPTQVWLNIFKRSNIANWGCGLSRLARPSRYYIAQTPIRDQGLGLGRLRLRIHLPGRVRPCSTPRAIVSCPR
jgi:hypothetical protein